MSVFVKIVFFAGLACSSVFAEVIGNLEFQPPISLKEWSFFEDSEADGKVLFKNYGHKSEQMTEIFVTTSATEFPGPLSSFDYSKLSDIKAFLRKKSAGFPGHQVTYEDIVVEPKSIFYKTTLYKEGKVVSYSWNREIVNETNWITFAYMLSFNGSVPSLKDLDFVVGHWITFLKDDLPKKTVCLKK